MIPVNIWDDYPDDCTGKEQSTFIYVENDQPDEQQKQCLDVLLDHLNKLKVDNTKFNLKFYDSAEEYPNLVGTENAWCLYKRWEIRVENLTHQQREQLVEQLNEAKLTLEGTPIRVYSES